MCNNSINTRRCGEKRAANAAQLFYTTEADEVSFSSLYL